LTAQALTFVGQIEQTMNNYDLAQGCLVLEVTEGLLIHYSDDVSTKM